MSACNVELARRGYEAALRGDLDAIRDLLDPDVKWHAGDPTALGACLGRSEAIAFMTRARKRRPLGELVEVIDAGERVVVVMRPRSEGDDTPPPSANVTTFREGKVVEMAHYPTVDAALAAVRG